MFIYVGFVDTPIDSRSKCRSVLCRYLTESRQIVGRYFDEDIGRPPVHRKTTNRLSTFYRLVIDRNIDRISSDVDVYGCSVKGFQEKNRQKRTRQSREVL